MYLKYKGKTESLVLAMPWFVAGPYTFSGQGDVTEVFEDDAVRLMQENPLMFDQVEAPEPKDPVKYSCPECGIEYSSQKGLNRHLKAAHGG